MTPLRLLRLVLAAAAASMVAAFTVGTTTTTTTTTRVAFGSRTALDASRRRKQVASRTAWLERRATPSSSSSPATTTSTTSTAPGRYTNEHGLSYIQLRHSPSGSTSRIYTYGAVVTSYIDGTGTEFIAVRPDAVFNGSKPISGGLAFCWPQFGPGPNMQQHGFARNVNWDVVEEEESSSSSSSTEDSQSSVTLVLRPSDYSRGIWNTNDFECRYTVTLAADQLVTKFQVENKGGETATSFDFQAALHSYFAVSSLKNLQIAGSFKGKQFLNKLAGTTGGGGGGELQMEDRDIITIAEEYDRVYQGVNDPVLMDAGTNKKLTVMNSAGWADTVLWSPYGNMAMGYDQFVCVESVKMDPVTLAPGATWTADMALVPSAI
jgi:glucose-6-phosphate 1-epimerase